MVGTIASASLPSDVILGFRRFFSLDHGFVFRIGFRTGLGRGGSFLNRIIRNRSPVRGFRRLQTRVFGAEIKTIEEMEP